MHRRVSARDKPLERIPVHSLRSKIFLVIILILALVAAGVMFFSKRDVERLMLQTEERSQKNVLHLMDLTIQGRYKTLLWDKVESVKRVKRNVKHLSELVLSGLRPYIDLHEQGQLQTDEAKEMALEWIGSLDIQGAYSFVYDEDNHALYHPRRELLGKDLTHIRDTKGRVMVEAAREDAFRYGSGYATFRHAGPDGGEPVKQFAFFVTIPEWDWVLGTASFVEDVEQAMSQRLQEILDVLQASLSEVHIARTGFVFIFDGEGRLLATPSQQHSQRILEGTADAQPLLAKLKHTAHDDQPQEVAAVIPDAAGQPQTMESYASYFKPLDWYIATAAPKSELEEPATRLLQRQAYIFAAVFVVALLLALGLASRLSRPLARLAEYAKSLPEQDFTREEPEDAPLAEAIRDLPRQHRDEVGRLAQSFIFMEGSLRENIKNLMQVTAAKQRIQSELAIASDIQMGLLPKIFPPFPDRPEFDLFAFLQPAKEVGGDLYDFFFINDTKLCFTVGDVSDKGVPAALFMAVTKTLINVVADQDPEPSAMLSMVNNELARDNPNAMFVTLIIAIIDLETGHVAYANGGHNRPVLFNDQGVDFLTGVSGPMAGAMEDMPFTPLETRLAPGDKLLLYTDGITEAMTETGKLYSDAKLIETTTALADASPKELLDGILKSVKAHAAGATQSDDITMLCLRYNGPPARDS